MLRSCTAVVLALLAACLPGCDKAIPTSLADYPGFWVSAGETGIFVSTNDLTVHLSNLTVIDRYERIEGDQPLSCEKVFKYSPGCEKGTCLQIVDGSSVDGYNGHVVFEGNLSSQQSADFDLVTGILVESDDPQDPPTLKLTLSPRSPGCLLTDQTYFFTTTLTWAPDNTLCPEAPECLPEPPPDPQTEDADKSESDAQAESEHQTAGAPLP